MNKKSLFQIFSASILIFSFTHFLWIFFNWFNSEFLYFLKWLISNDTNKNIIVIEIDNLTYNKLWFPIDRWDYVPFLDNLKKSQPAVIWFDVLFLDKWKDEKKDKEFAEKIKELWNVVLWFDIKNQKEAIMPYKTFNDALYSAWYFQPIINPDTQKVSSIEPFKELVLNWKKSYYESFSFSVLRSYYNLIFWKNDKIISPKVTNNKYSFFWKEIPIIYSNISGRRYSEFIIKYTQSNLFKRESFYNVYTWNFDEEEFKDKIVLIWFTAEWVKDDFIVPSLWITKWVYIHANAINNILNWTFVIYFDKKIELLISFLFIFLLMYLNLAYLKTVNLRWIIFWAIFSFVLLACVYLTLFMWFNFSSWLYILPNFPLQFILVLFLSFFASSVLKYVNEDKNKKRLSKALSEYVSSDIAKEILTSSWTVKLNWERKKITMFFSDIAGFTTISERMDPENLVSFLKIYLWTMSDIIMDNKWFINKYEWDAIMALWWVFNSDETFWVISACSSALLQQKMLNVLNEEFERTWVWAIKVRMWIHVWDAIIWNIWSEWRKMEFTALWDNVNLASRLEWVNKFYWTNICVSEGVYEIWKELFVFRFLDKIKVKWKNISVNIYELIWHKWEISDLKIEIINTFQWAIRDYFDRDFNLAKEKFSKLVELWDEPSREFVHRCEVYLDLWVWDDWDGVWTMKNK